MSIVDLRMRIFNDIKTCCLIRDFVVKIGEKRTFDPQLYQTTNIFGPGLYQTCICFWIFLFERNPVMSCVSYPSF
jgi:hypothetical protein